MTNEHILNSWKEISSYLGRGVRTVQRWEVFFGMPVHRPAGKERSAVVAFAAELDAWLQSERTQVTLGMKTLSFGLQQAPSEQLQRMRLETNRLYRQTDELMIRHNQLNEHLKRAIDLKNKLEMSSKKQDTENSQLPLKPAI